MRKDTKFNMYRMKLKNSIDDQIGAASKGETFTT
jgi:hypothetical protein